MFGRDEMVWFIFVLCCRLRLVLRLFSGWCGAVRVRFGLGWFSVVLVGMLLIVRLGVIFWSWNGHGLGLVDFCYDFGLVRRGAVRLGFDRFLLFFVVAVFLPSKFAAS